MENTQSTNTTKSFRTANTGLSRNNKNVKKQKNKIGYRCIDNTECINKNCVNNICTRKKNKSVQQQPRQQTPRQKIIHSATLKKQKNKIGNRCIDNTECLNNNCVNNICTRKRKTIATPIKSKKTDTSSSTKKMPTRTIQKFMLLTKHNRTSNYLKHICSDSGLCISFGIENNKIKLFFNKFVTFDYATIPIKAIGNVSANGFVKEIQFKHRNYVAYSILKSSSRTDGDNLWFEYMVGLNVNNWSTYLPCFIETYGLFKYKNDILYNHAKQTQTITDKNFLRDSLTLVSTPESSKNQVFDYADICKNSKHYAILLQHIRGISFESILTATNNEDKLALLAQVYLPLAALTNDFVHNDLHSNNVMLFEPSAGKYIHFYYYDTQGSAAIEFKSYYVAKIIDYGRSYITNGSSLKKKICATRDCDPRCGDNYGLGWLNDTLDKDTFFISSIKNNPSHDLRLYKRVFPKRADVKYGVGITNKNEKSYGTKPDNKPYTGKLILNVTGVKHDMNAHFRKATTITYYSGPNYPMNNKFGEMHVYLDLSAPVRFVKS